MAPKEKRTLKRIEGVGPLFKGERQIAKVWYLLPIAQEFNTVESPEGTKEIPGPLDILGEFRVVEGDPRIQNGEHVTLHLKEGPKIEIEVVDYEGDQGFFQLPQESVEDFLLSMGLKE